MRIDADYVRDIGLLKHYRIIRKWACSNYELSDADLELLIYFDSMGFFTKKDFLIGTYTYSWDNRRWNRLLKDGWIVVWRNRNWTTQKHNIYKVSFKCKHIITRMYKMMLGQEDIPTNKSVNHIMKGEKYKDTVLITAIKNVNNDITRNNNDEF